MATLEPQDTNILDAEAVNWRLIIYPIIAALILLVGGFVIYIYQQDQREQHEAQARQAMLQAKTPEALTQVADEFPNTTHAVLSLLSAANLSFDKKDYPAAAKDYQRIVDGTDTDIMLRDSARLGLASTQEATDHLDDAINTYLAVAQRGNATPYAPYAYHAAAHLYEQKNDLDNERKVLTEAAALGGDSPFVKEAQYKLRNLSGGGEISSSDSNAAPSTSLAPAPANSSNLQP